MPVVNPLDVAAVSAITLAGIAATTAYGVMYAESQLFGRTIVAPPLPNQLALTFDDGPNPTATPRLLAVLARRNVQATFFLIGDFVRLEPVLAREIAAAGHTIGNHTMTHPFLPKYSAARIQAELAGCNALLEDTLGRKVELFRPPHGGRTPAVFRAAATLDLKIVQWNLIVSDWKGDPAAMILERIERGIARHRRAGRGTNLVLHDGGQDGLGQPRMRSVEALEMLLARVAADTEFVVPTVDEARPWK